MLPLLMLLATPDPETAIDAERAFNRAAQIEGQWTAFRKFSTPDAVLFTPQPQKAHDILPEKNPPIAVQWWPAQSYVSCDATVAVNTGPWVRPGSMGYFTTVWVRQSDGHYKWVYDGGDTLATPRPLPEQPKVRTASCSGTGSIIIAHDISLMAGVEPNPNGNGHSRDSSLSWHWSVEPSGARRFVVELWNGKAFDVVIDDRIKAPPAQ